jgi:hypothetical protein
VTPSWERKGVTHSLPSGRPVSPTMPGNGPWFPARAPPWGPDPFVWKGGCHGDAITTALIPVRCAVDGVSRAIENSDSAS